MTAKGWVGVVSGHGLGAVARWGGGGMIRVDVDKRGCPGAWRGVVGVVSEGGCGLARGVA